MTTTYYIFRGNGQCGKCKAMTGVYTVEPGRPHPNCGCEIVEIDEGNCGNFRYSGSPWPDDPYGAPVKDVGGGREKWRVEVEVNKEDGSTEKQVIEVDVPSDMPHEDKMEAIDNAAEDAAEQIEDCPFLCC